MKTLMVGVAALVLVGCQEVGREAKVPYSFQCGALQYHGPDIPEKVWEMCSQVIERDHERAIAARQK